MNVLELLEYEEGYRSKAYHCTEGFVTIGIGKKIGPKNASLSWYQFEVSRPIAFEWLREEVESIEGKLLDHKWFVDLGVQRKAIIISMCYQLGYNGFMKFKKAIAAIEAKDWPTAAYEMLDSRWYAQTPDRAKRHAKVIEAGHMGVAY